MEIDWRGRLILRKLEEGCTIRESAAAVGITLEREIKELKTEAERIADEASELAGEVPF